MFIDIKAMGFKLTEAIGAHARARIRAALGPFARRIPAVTARLDDINAGRGGVDKRCSIVVTLPGHGTVVTGRVHEDLYRAVDEAANRLRRSVKRRLRRRTRGERKDPQRPGALAAY